MLRQVRRRARARARTCAAAHGVLTRSLARARKSPISRVLDGTAIGGRGGVRGVGRGGGRGDGLTRRLGLGLSLPYLQRSLS